MIVKPEYQIGEKLNERNWKLATAESCTGGLIGHRITNVPGSSEYYLGGVIAYAYEAKEQALGVRHDTLLEFGAVSQETVLEMACGARNLFQADVAIAVSGIAGPGGGFPINRWEPSGSGYAVRTMLGARFSYSPVTASR